MMPSPGLPLAACSTKTAELLLSIQLTGCVCQALISWRCSFVATVVMTTCKQGAAQHCVSLARGLRTWKGGVQDWELPRKAAGHKLCAGQSSSGL